MLVDLKQGINKDHYIRDSAKIDTHPHEIHEDQERSDSAKGEKHPRERQNSLKAIELSAKCNDGSGNP